MAKKDKNQKVQKPVQGLQTDVAQITATGRVIAEHPSNFITPQKMRALFEDAERGDITAQHELFADIEERDSDIAANLGTRKRALLTLDWRITPPRNATPAEDKLAEAAPAPRPSTACTCGRNRPAAWESGCGTIGKTPRCRRFARWAASRPRRRLCRRPHRPAPPERPARCRRRYRKCRCSRPRARL